MGRGAIPSVERGWHQDSPGPEKQLRQYGSCGVLTAKQVNLDMWLPGLCGSPYKTMKLVEG